eukprot:4660996-Pleurochrysis_carterae.AAC.7
MFPWRLLPLVHWRRNEEKLFFDRYGATVQGGASAKGRTTCASPSSSAVEYVDGALALILEVLRVSSWLRSQQLRSAVPRDTCVVPPACEAPKASFRAQGCEPPPPPPPLCMA